MADDGEMLRTFDKVDAQRRALRQMAKKKPKGHPAGGGMRSEPAGVEELAPEIQDANRKKGPANC